MLAAAGLLAWASWGWGAVGLVLTAASALPGLLGSAAGIAVRVVLPVSARRSAAVILGLGLGVAGPLLGTALAPVPAASAAVRDWPARAASETERRGPPPDWPAESVADPVMAPVPDWPPGPPAGAHVVVRGDCLWSIAGTWLLQQHGRAPVAAEVATAVRAWWAANEAVIGADPDLLLPGQVLRPPP